MNIIEPKVELWEQSEDKISHVARCARVYYNKETSNDITLYNSLEQCNYLNMFYHETYYSAVPIKYHDGIIYRVICDYVNSPYIKYFSFKDNVYIIINGNYLRNIKRNNPVLYSLILKYKINILEAKNIEYIWSHFMRYTFCIVTQISTSIELNEVNSNSIAEQSTKFVYENGSICRPHWISKEEAELFNNDNNADLDEAMNIYLNSCKRSFEEYKILIDKYKIHHQDAKGILPLDTVTKYVHTYSIDEWRNIIDLYYYSAIGTLHSNAKIITGMIRDELIKLSYNFK